MIRMIVAPLLFLATAAGAQQCVYKDVMTDADIEACRHPPPAVSTTTKPGTNAKQPAYNLEQHGGSYSGAATDKAAWEHIMGPGPKYAPDQIKEPEIGVTTTADEPRLQQKCGFYIKKNITKNRGGQHEQWVCGGGRYLYFDNGVLTSIQE